MQHCRCIPWDMVRNDTEYDYELCDSGGNSCFWQKMQVKETMAKECFCLSDCSNVKYTHSTTLKPYNMVSQCNSGWFGIDTLFSSTSIWSQRALVLSKILGPMTNITDWTKYEKAILDDYAKTLCNAVIEDKAVLVIELEGSTFTKLKRSLRVTFTDKLGSIGGTLGLFLGFSLLAVVELIHWVFRIVLSFIPIKNQSLS